jgi:NADH-quinone oxidoreductase subunit G
MVEVEIDGQKVEVPEGSVVMHAANAAGVYVPHFCYHKKLSIAANCRMCLVDIEKAPKPMPACATPVSAGMKVLTKSEKAVKAQQSVMEFLLINHPLDCPICDQGGECQLQDLAVGYGGSSSKYSDEKRVVFHKSMGPLISSEEMSRCIHCTRCVRFGQEIAGVMELGMAGRGEHAEIMSFLGESVDSELSGNMIDVCPVGALTSKPFRYSARTWELNRRKSVAPHDSLGSNIVVQIKNNKVMRVVPLENEAVNECWISDRDRFSYEGLNSAERLTKPMIKQDGHWLEVDWPTAMNYALHALSMVSKDHGGAQIAGMASASSTVEELYLFQQTLAALGSANVDTRLRQSDFRLEATAHAAPWMGTSVASLSEVSRVLLIGSFLRKDHPLLASRFRAAAKRGAQINTLHAVNDDLLMNLTHSVVTAPSGWVAVLAQVVQAIALQAGVSVPSMVATIVAANTATTANMSDQASAIAKSLMSGAAGKKAILLGNAAVQHADYASIALLSQAIASMVEATCGQIGDAANSVGAYLANAVPQSGGLNALQMVLQPRKAYLLMGVEPSLDHGSSAIAQAALASAHTVIALTVFKSDELLETADCLLPITPFTETSGTYVNAEGVAQSFNGVVKAAGEARPAWKILRVMAETFGSKTSAFDSSEAVLEVALKDSAQRLAKAYSSKAVVTASVLAKPALERIADVPLYCVDALVRRAPALQLTRDARAPKAFVNVAQAAKLGLAAGSKVSISQEGSSGKAIVDLAIDAGLADGVVRLSAAHASTAMLASMVGAVEVAKA